MLQKSSSARVTQVVLAAACVVQSLTVSGTQESSAPTLQAEISAAVRRAAPTFTVSQGVYNFNSTSLIVHKATNFTLVFEAGCELWFRLGAGVLFDECDNVTVIGNGVAIDYDPLPFFQATVVSAARSTATNEFWTVDVEVDSGSLSPEGFWATWGANPANEFVQGPQWWSGAFGAAFPRTFSAFSSIRQSDFQRIRNTSNTYSYTASSRDEPRPNVGDKITAIVRLGYTWLLHNSTRCTSRNVTIHTTSSMAITEFDGRGGHVYDSVNVVRRNLSAMTEVPNTCGPARNRVCLATVASNADVFHSSGCRRGPVVRNCEFSYALDDYINIHTRFQVATRFTLDGSNPVVTVADPRLRLDYSVPDDFPYGTVESMTNVRSGDILSFHDVDSLEQVFCGTVATVTRFPADSAEINLAQAAVNNLTVASGAPFKPSDVYATLSTGVNISRVWSVTLEPIVSFATPDLTRTLVSIDSWQNDGAVVEDNYFHDSIDGVRWKSSGGSFARNTWKPAVALTGLEVTPLRSFYEGPLVISNVLILNNTFFGGKESLISMCTGMSHIESPPWKTCKNITISGNMYPLSP